MNYLTAIIALPLFIALFCFELWLAVSRRAHVQSAGVNIVISSVIVSFLQAVSCIFWFFGFVTSKLDNVFSEGMDDDESMGCFGLVGAEVLLACFQLLFSCQTIYTCGLMRRVYHRSVLNRSMEGIKVSTGEKVAAAIGGVLLLAYTALAFVTAQNRRCKQGNHYLMQLQHHFYPIYLGLDVLSSTATWYYCSRIVASIDPTAPVLKTRLSTITSGSGANHTSASSLDSGRAVNPNAAAARSTHTVMRELAAFYKKQTVLSMVGGVFAVGMFVVQFVAHVSALSLIACIFCVCMYIVYAARRLPILILYTKWDYTVVLRCMRRPEAAASGAASTASGSGLSSERMDKMSPLTSPSSLPRRASTTVPRAYPNARFNQGQGLELTSVQISADGGSSLAYSGTTQAVRVSVSDVDSAVQPPSASAGTRRIERLASPSAASAASAAAPAPMSPSAASPRSPGSPRRKMRVHSSQGFTSDPQLTAAIAKLVAAVDEQV